MSREGSSLAAPGAIDESFPAVRPRRRIWFRSHQHRPSGPDGGCWFYASLPAPTGPGGRFDLPAPRGTCYLADSELAAARERLGRPGSLVAHDEVQGAVVSCVRFAPGRLADLLHRQAANHGVTGELSASGPYALTQRWAQAFAEAKCDGVRYQPRFSTERAIAIAVFGAAGAPSVPRVVSSTRTMAEVLRDAGYTVAPPPTVAGLGALL